MTTWQLSSEDLPPVFLIALLPILVAFPQLVGFLKADPALYTGAMATDLAPGLIRGVPFIDPNNGFTTHALGYRAALDWLEGVVPWWNPYSGVGLPLAGEYQPAVFFPLTLLLLFSKGMVLQQLALQLLTGWGTYGLLRQLSAGRAAATVGAILYSFNGTLAWLAHGPAQVLPFLPWMLWGIERAYASAMTGERSGWRMLAAAMAMSLLAGFPETAYINGLLAFCWAVLRGMQLAPAQRSGFATRIMLGGIVGVCAAAPQILAFFQDLPLAHVGEHATFGHFALLPQSAIPSFIAPYAFGTPFGHHHQWSWLLHSWAMGGYVSIALLGIAAYGFLSHRDPLRWLLLAWTVTVLAKTFGIEPFAFLWNLIPGVSISAFARFSQPSWELALVIMAAWGLDDLARAARPRRRALAGATLFVVTALGAALAYGAYLWPALRDPVALRNCAVFSAVYATLSAAACILLIRGATWARARVFLAVLLAGDAMLLFAIPTLSNPRGGDVDRPAIAFLQDNLGLQRFYTLGPIQPNYGALYGIASINHNYLPVSRAWVDWIRSHLDAAVDPVVFNGNYPRHPGEPPQADELRRNVASYRWAGVKYVVSPPGIDPFGPPDDASRAGTRLAYEDATLRIYELSDPAPYFEAIAGSCRIEPRGRTEAAIDCPLPARLLRRELFYPGWRATVNGRDAAISEHGALFQAIDVPAGRTEVRFHYAPPHVEWAWLASLLSACALIFPSARRLMRRK